MKRLTVIAIVVAVTVWAWGWVAGGAADAATTYQFFRAQKWLSPQDNPVELGLLSIRIEPLLDGTHAALFALPEGFGLVTPNDTPSIEDASVIMAVVATAGNEFRGVVSLAGVVPRATFLIPIRSTIASTKGGDIEINIGYLDGQLSNSTVVAGQVLPGELTIQSSRAGSIVDGKSAVEITFTENMAGLLRKDSPIKLTLPEGFGWAEARGTPVGGEGLQARLVVNGRTLELRTDRESTRRAVFRVEAEVRVTDAARAGAGEVRARVEGLRELSAATLLVARYEAPEPEPKPEPKPEPARTAVFTIGGADYTTNGVRAAMDATPYLKGGRTYLPLRYVGYALGADVAWDGEKGQATLVRDGTTVRVTMGSGVLVVNDTLRPMDVTPELVPPGRIMLPYRFIAEAFGADVTWNPVTRTVTMTL